MAIKLNVNRTQTIEVPIPTEGGKFESFFCEMRILKNTDNKEIKVVDLIVDVKGLELVQEETGRILNKEETIEAIKNDDQLGQLVVSAWHLGNEQIAKKQRTLLERSST